MKEAFKKVGLAILGIFFFIGSFVVAGIFQIIQIGIGLIIL